MGSSGSALRERDEMMCRSCGRAERASEGYPCLECGTFLCLRCEFKGVTRCRQCTAAAESPRASRVTPGAVRPLRHG